MENQDIWRITFYKTGLKVIIVIFLSCFICQTISWVSKNFYNNNKLEMANDVTKGGDYLAFYTGGLLYSTNKKDLYNLDVQKDIQDSILRKEQKQLNLPYIYPPIIAYIFSFLAKFPFLTSLYFYLTFILIFTICIITILQKTVTSKISSFPNTFFNFFLLLGFVPFSLNCIFGGQLAYFGLCISVFALYAIYKKNDFLLGLILSCSYYKPPLFLIFVIYSLLRKGKNFFLGFLLGSTIFILSTLYLVGLDGFIEYLKLASGYTYGQKFGNQISLPESQGAGLFGLVATIISGKMALYCYPLFILTAILLAIKNKSQKLLAKQLACNDSRYIELYEYSLIFILSIGFSMQCIRYDLTILFPSFLILLSLNNYIKNNIKYILYFGIFLFYIEFMFRELHIFNTTVNLSSFIFLIFLFPFIWGLLKKENDNARQNQTNNYSSL